MLRRRWPTSLSAAALVAGLLGCSGDDDTGSQTTAFAATSAEAATTADPPTTTAADTTVTTPATTTPPSLTTPASVVTDTEASGGSTLATVDLPTGRATTLGAVGTEVGVLGIAVDADGNVVAVTDAPALLVLDPRALDAAVTATPVDAGGDTLLALARRSTDGALFAIGDSGGIFRIDPGSGDATPIAEVGLEDPGVGLDVTADGALEVIVVTGARYRVDVDTGAVADLPAPSADEAPPRIVAVAHDASGRYGIDAATDELVAIADDGTVEVIGPLGLDVTDGASLDIGPDGDALIANPG